VRTYRDVRMSVRLESVGILKELMDVGTVQEDVFLTSMKLIDVLGLLKIIVQRKVSKNETSKQNE
jgi:hypothetical protein